MAGATVHVWQTNGDGDYGTSRGRELRCCYLQGTMTTDADGRYQFQTVKPGHYGGPAHIHFQVRTRAGSRQHPYLRGIFDIVLPSP